MFKKYYLLIMSIVVVLSINLFSSNLEFKKPTAFVELKAKNENSFTKITPPEILAKQNTSSANFIVDYNGFSPQAQTAFQFAVNIWASILSSNVPIRVEANWVVLDPNVLGSASAATFYRDYANAPKTNTWYSVALAEKLHGNALNSADSADIKANFNSNFANWYFGTDGNCPAGQFDFVTVVLHELCHGLGFQGSMDVNSGLGSWGFGSGFPFIYDFYTENELSQKLLNTSIFQNPSTTLGNVLVSNNIYFNGNVSVSINGYNPVKLYSPSTWEATSSYSHLDEVTFPAGTINSLMTPSLGQAEAIHTPGNIALGIFEDIGWTTNLVTNTTMVHPGDTDNNGEVNANDILPIGIYFLEQGSPRQQITFTWGPKEILVWGNTAATYADANGDGIIDEKDIIGIGVNWGNTHNKNINSYEIDYQNRELLLRYKNNFEQIYYSLHGTGKATISTKKLLNSVFEFEKDIPNTFTLEQNYPNPFNPTTNIRFNLPEKQRMHLIITNTLGQVVSHPIRNAVFEPGIHDVKINANTLSNGIYYYTIKSDKYYMTRKMIVLK